MVPSFDPDRIRQDFARRIGAANPLDGLPEGPSGDPVVDAAVPSRDAIFGWIERIVGQGVRRAGYPADSWAEEWIADRFREFGLDRVRMEPIRVRRWVPRRWSLTAKPAGRSERTLDCFPVPYTPSVEHAELELAAFGAADVAGRACLYDVTPLRIPADLELGTLAPHRVFDPDGTMKQTEQVLPFGRDEKWVLEPSLEAGATAFIGTLEGYPGDSCRYYLPYDAVERPIPGVWISGSDGAWLREQLAAGPVKVTLTAVSTVEECESNNVVGELPGADDDMVIIGSHHDGPWASAVEDASGVALVLAQARYWATLPADRRPHRLVFVLHGGHMAGGAGLRAFLGEHLHELDSAVLEVHLEHAANEFVDRDGALVPNGLNVPRWFFTSEIPPLEVAVKAALVEENLKRSLVLPPTVFGGEFPPTDGGAYSSVGGVPIVNFLSAPWYLFDEADTLDKIDTDNLVPLTRATIRIVNATRGVSAARWRAALPNR